MSLASEVLCATDPGELMRRAGMNPDPHQGDYLLSDHPAIILLQSRQTGKSETTAAKCVHRAQYRERSLVIAVGAAQRQADEVMRKAHLLHAASPAVPLKGRPAERHMDFANGSRFLSLPASEATGRGFSGVKLLVLDESARILDRTYASFDPFLAVSNGDMVLLSSAFGKRGFFWHEWAKGLPRGWETIFAERHLPKIEVSDGEFDLKRALSEAERGHGWQLFNEEMAALGGVKGGWKRYLVTADDCPRISDAFLRKDLNAAGIGPDWVMQEFYCKFHEAVGAMFSYDLIVDALSRGQDAYNFQPGAVDQAVSGSMGKGRGFFGGGGYAERRS